jgi:hypothetical protein
MKKLKQLLYTALLICNAVSCQIGIDRTTQILGTVTDNDTGKPIEGLELWIQGESGILASQAVILTTLKTDKNGEYFISLTPSKDYHSLKISNRFINNSLFEDKYKTYLVSYNNIPNNGCCIVRIGEKNQYDYKMVSK